MAAERFAKKESEPCSCAPQRIPGDGGVALTASAARAETYTSLMVFGDSLSDVGNEHAVHGDVMPLYYNFRNSNGPLWVDDLAAKLGEPSLTASLSGGTDYAYGGATASTNASWTWAPSLTAQVSMFVGAARRPRRSARADTLFGPGRTIFFSRLAGLLEANPRNKVSIAIMKCRHVKTARQPGPIPYQPPSVRCMRPGPLTSSSLIYRR